MRILFVTLTNIGDAVLSTAALNRLLLAYPKATVDVVAGPRAACLFEGLPFLGSLIPLHKQKHHRHYFSLWKELRNREYDVILDVRTAFLPHVLKADKKITFTPCKGLHRAEQFARLWPDEAAPALCVWPTIPEETRRKITQFAPKGQKLMVLSPTANWLGKQWPQRYWAALDLGKKMWLNGWKFVVLGAAHERSLVEDFLVCLPKDRVLDLVGETSLPEACGWLERGDFFLGHDSGLAHIAAAYDTLGLALFGPTDDGLYRPYSPHIQVVCAPKREKSSCNLEPSAPSRLMSDLPPHQVVDVLCEMVQNCSASS